MIQHANSNQLKIRFEPPSNTELAEKLELASKLLVEQGANRFRAHAYRRAADTLRQIERPVWRIYQEDGIYGLEELPAVGRTISRALQQLIRGGRWTLLQRLQGNDVIENAFVSVPNIGPKLAARIHEELGIESLAELQAAAWDGRLAKMSGMGRKRVQAVQESLAGRGRLCQSFESANRTLDCMFRDIGDLTAEIPVAEILDVDDEYRFKAQQNQLPRAAPRKNNPSHEHWLPILHTERDDRHYTAMFSNTDHAHAMSATHDWVVVYLEDHNHRGQHGRWTVITSQFGKLRGRRIVRGRERECETFYKSAI